MLPDGALSINSPLALMRARADRRRPPELILADEEQAALLLLLFISGVARRLVSLQGKKKKKKSSKETEKTRQKGALGLSWLMVRIDQPALMDPFAPERFVFLSK